MRFGIRKSWVLACARDFIKDQSPQYRLNIIFLTFTLFDVTSFGSPTIMKSPTLLTHLRDILILPFTVVCIVPYLIYDGQEKSMLDDVYWKIGGAILLVFGLCLFLYALYLFKTIAKGTVAPWSPKQNLVVVGPYRFCRNPMISGVLFILVGEALILGSPGILWWAVIFFFINTLYFVGVEEPMLLDRFGEDYRHYKQHVPRWIPRIQPYKPEHQAG